MFLGCLLLLSFAATTPYSKSADLALISVRLAIVVFLSILVVRERWRRRHDLQRRSSPRSDAGDTILRRFRRWYHDEQKDPG
jgi:hypothetical protein